jgi:hypothetical protein
MTDEPMFGHLDAGSLRRLIQEEDDAKFDQRLARLQRVRLHKIIPHLWFDVASTECRDLFRDDHFYGCVCLTQSVAEALAKFVLEVHKEKIGKQRRPIELCKKPITGKKLIDRLRKLKGGTRNGEPISVLSQGCIDAFERIEGRDRDDFHHLNKGVATEREKLEKRAEECVSSLYEIESELFRFGVDKGVLVPLQPQYWPRPDAGDQVRVFLRSH